MSEQIINDQEVQEPEAQTGVEKKLAELLAETKTAKQRSRELELQVTDLQAGSDQFKTAYSELVKTNLINDILSKADINAAGKSLVTAYIKENLEEHDLDGMPALKVKGFDDVASFAESIKTNKDFAACVTVHIGGCTIIGTTIVPNLDRKPDASYEGLGLR